MILDGSSRVVSLVPEPVVHGLMQVLVGRMLEVGREAAPVVEDEGGRSDGGQAAGGGHPVGQRGLDRASSHAHGAHPGVERGYDERGGHQHDGLVARAVARGEGEDGAGGAEAGAAGQQAPPRSAAAVAAGIFPLLLRRRRRGLLLPLLGGEGLWRVGSPFGRRPFPARRSEVPGAVLR